MQKNVVTIDVEQNEIWEVERVYPLERTSYWWTKPELKQIRDDYKNEVMMQGVKNLVKARVEQEEEDKGFIEERVAKIMQLDPGSIANFLQSIPKKVEKLPTTLNSNFSPNGSNLISKPESILDTDSGSNTDSGSDSDISSDSDSESFSSGSSSSSSDNEDERHNAGLTETRISFKFTARPAALSINNWNAASKLLSTSNKEKDSNSYSSSSSCPLLSFSKDSLTPSKSYGELNTQNVKNETHGDGLRPISLVIGTAHEMMNLSISNPTTSAASTSKKIKPILSESNTEMNCILQTEKSKSGKNRFKQGVLALLAMDRLEKIVKRNSSPPFALYNMLSSSSRLVDIYLPSDDENQDDADATRSDTSVLDSSCEDISECPICLGLVDPKQQRKIILLRRMLCRRCFFSYYINREEKYRNVDDEEKGSRPIYAEIRSNNDESCSNMGDDVEIMNSLKQCNSSTKRSDVILTRMFPKSKSPMLVDQNYLNTKGGQTIRSLKVTTLRRNKTSRVRVNGEQSCRKR